ncbi:polysaccharide biosynthesis tyrosine autokinase [Amnibacterium sp.]|uniref:polysaccharide biosynthesis tyrosine autokinase n=1 Tax=Amnibacterium sp. TaxID=1872496 RepID=UPI002620E717|nr:polysaccharide biosynthesis tyrosine autokinase [Amnibacterium sp.]MCU1473897.1 chromosome partitioning protein [Amnibacterium sp.]
MELRDYLRVIARSWLLIVLAVALGAGAGYGFTRLQTPQYRMTATAFASISSASTVSDLSTGTALTEDAVRSYASLAKTSYVLKPVIGRLGLNESVEHLANRLDVNVGVNTVVLQVAATDPSRRGAASIANAVTDQLARAVVALTPQRGTSSPSIVLTRVQPATGTPGPATPSLPLDLVIGALTGLLLGLVGAFMRGSLDTRLRTALDVQQIVDAPVLGHITFDPQAKSRPLLVARDSHGPRAEAFRALRTNLEFLDLDSAPRSLVVTSSVESEGKSTTAANLAIAAANVGRSVLLVDADLRRPKVATYMGLDGRVGLTDVLIGRVELDQALQSWGDGTLQVLPAGAMPPNPGEVVQSQAMAELIRRVSERFDLVIIDSPPLLPVLDGAVLARRSDGALLVVAARRARRPQLAAAVEALTKIDARLLGLVVTMLPRHGPDALTYTYRYDRPKATEGTGTAAGDDLLAAGPNP